MSSAVELIREVSVRSSLDAPGDGARFRDHVERAAHAVGVDTLALNPEIPHRAMLANERFFFRIEHVVVGGADGELFSTLWPSLAHRVLQVVVIALACVALVAAGLATIMALARFVFPGYGLVVLTALVVLTPALVQASHRFALEHWLAARQREIARHVSHALEPSTPYRSARDTVN